MKLRKVCLAWRLLTVLSLLITKRVMSAPCSQLPIGLRGLQSRHHMGNILEGQSGDKIYPVSISWGEKRGFEHHGNRFSGGGKESSNSDISPFSLLQSHIENSVPL